MITDCLVKSQNTRHVCHSRKACPWPDMTEGIYLSVTLMFLGSRPCRHEYFLRK